MIYLESLSKWIGEQDLREKTKIKLKSVYKSELWGDMIAYALKKKANTGFS